MYVVLIGSVAKNEENENSDIDICRIGTEILIEKDVKWPKGPISYIDYSIEEFSSLYEKGSLFIYHILKEGLLLNGSEKNWNFLVEKFNFKDTYGEEVEKIRIILQKILEVDIYGSTFLSFYSNLFTLLKNFSIFLLAHQGNFEFNKRKAFNQVLGEKYYELLYYSYNKFERGINLKDNKIDFLSQKLARDVIEYFKNKMELINNVK